MELNVIVVCGTIIVVTIFGFMLLKGKSDGELEWDAKTGKIRLRKASKNIKHNLDNIEAIKSEFNENRKVDPYVDKLKSYKDFIISIIYATTEIRVNLYKFLRENNITSMNINQYETYSREKIQYIFDKFDGALKNSKDPLVKELSCKFLLDTYLIIIKNNLLNIFKSIYSNHKELNAKRLDAINLIVAQTEDRTEIMNLMFSQVYKDINAALDMDENLLNEAIYDINNTLIGLWHDYLLEYNKLGEGK